jgi:hypothetical protein
MANFRPNRPNNDPDRNEPSRPTSDDDPGVVSPRDAASGLPSGIRGGRGDDSIFGGSTLLDNNAEASSLVNNENIPEWEFKELVASDPDDGDSSGYALPEKEDEVELEF